MQISTTEHKLKDENIDILKRIRAGYDAEINGALAQQRNNNGLMKVMIMKQRKLR